MSEKKLIDATELCQYLSNWQLSCAGNVTGGEGARDNLVIYNTLDKVMEVIKNAPAEEQRVYNVRVDKDKLDAMQKVLTQQVHLIAMETNKDIAKELDALGANACSFRVGDCVMGMTVHSFKNLMSVAARALRGGADNAGKE